MYTHAQDIITLIMLWFIELFMAVASVLPASITGMNIVPRAFCLTVFIGTTWYLIQEFIKGW